MIIFVCKLSLESSHTISLSSHWETLSIIISQSWLGGVTRKAKYCGNGHSRAVDRVCVCVSLCICVCVSVSLCVSVTLKAKYCWPPKSPRASEAIGRAGPQSPSYDLPPDHRNTKSDNHQNTIGPPVHWTLSNQNTCHWEERTPSTLRDFLLRNDLKKMK